MAVLADHLRVAVRAHHPDLVTDVGVLERLARGLHLGLVVLRPHDDPDERGIDLDLLERCLDLRHRNRAGGGRRSRRLRTSQSLLLHESPCIRGQRAVAPRASTGGAPMSERICFPWNSIRPAAVYARSRACAGVEPMPVTFSTRPPAVITSPPVAAVPAGGVSTPWTAAAPASPGVTSPLELHSGEPAEARTRVTVQSSPNSARTPASPPGSRDAWKSSTRSLCSLGRTAWVSGSPNRQLNSRTMGPSAVIISPA